MNYDKGSICLLLIPQWFKFRYSILLYYLANESKMGFIIYWFPEKSNSFRFVHLISKSWIFKLWISFSSYAREDSTKVFNLHSFIIEISAYTKSYLRKLKDRLRYSNISYSWLKTYTNMASPLILLFATDKWVKY